MAKSLHPESFRGLITITKFEELKQKKYVNALDADTKSCSQSVNAEHLLKQILR